MISYIFKSKTKNILAIIFTLLYILKPMCEFWVCIAHYQFFSWSSFFTIIPLALILTCLFTLNYNYRFKQALIPAAFLIWIIAQICVIYSDLNAAFSYLELFGELPVTITSVLSVTIVLIVAKALCFVGALSNFKNIVFLKIGLIISIVVIAVIGPIVEMVSAAEYFGTTNTFFDYLLLLNTEVIFGRVANTLFYVGLLLMAFNKKSADIDITPRVEARRAKREEKKKAKLQQKEAEEAELNAPLPEIPEGHWRCMACGKFLPDMQNRCECGYKK